MDGIRDFASSSESVSPDAAFAADALLLDFYGVIFDDTLWSRWLFQLVSRMGLNTSYGAFVHAWEQQYLREVNVGRREFWDAVRELLSSLGLRRGQVEEACVAGQARRRQFDESVRPLPGVKSGLAQLATRGCLVGAICNGPLDAGSARHKLARLQLETHFAAILSSRECRENPAARYQLAAARLRVRAERLLFVSSNTMELQEAAAAGLQCLGWQMRVPPAGMAVSHDFGDLLRLVRSAPVHSLAG